MRLVMTLLVRDEAELVRTNLDFHLSRGVDFVVAADNGSTDGTREVLEEYQRRGVLALIDQPGDDFQQDAWVTRLCHLAHDEFGADWVFANDADELWWAAEGSLRPLLARTRADVLILPRVELLPTREQTLSPGYALHWNVLRPLRALGAVSACVKGKALFRARGFVSIEAGNHDVLWPGAKRARGKSPDGVMIYHFPYRTFAAFERKVKNGGAALRRNAAWPESWGVHWRTWYRAHEEGRLTEVFASLVPTRVQATRALATGQLTMDLTIATHFEPARLELPA